MNEIMQIDTEVTIETPEGALTFTHDHAIKAEMLLRRMYMSFVEMGNDLVEFRDSKLFYIVGCDSFEDFLMMTPIGVKTGMRQIEQAELLANRLNPVAFAQTPPTYLLDILKNEELSNQVDSGEVKLEKNVVILPDGEEVPYSVLAKRIREELREEVENDNAGIKKLKTQRDEAVKEKKDAKAQLEEAEKTTHIQNVEIQRLKDAIGALSDQSGVTEEFLASWASKDKAMQRIAELFITVEQGVTLVNNLHENLMSDPDVVSQVAALKTLLNTSLSRIQNTYGPAFYNIHPSLAHEEDPEHE